MARYVRAILFCVAAYVLALALGTGPARCFGAVMIAAIAMSATAAAAAGKGRNGQTYRQSCYDYFFHVLSLVIITSTGRCLIAEAYFWVI
jgi:hypothetical protein